MTLVTTLLDAAIDPGADRAALDHQRWQVETALAHLKTTRQRDGLRGHTGAGMLQEWPIVAPVVTLPISHGRWLGAIPLAWGGERV